MLRSLLAGLLLLGLGIASSAHAAIVWTCTPAIESLLPGGGPYLGFTICTSDAGNYDTGGNCLGVGCSATADSQGAVLCGSSARTPIAVMSTSAGPAAGTSMNPSIYDTANWKLQLFEGSTAGTSLTQKTPSEAITASSIVRVVSVCQ